MNKKKHWPTLEMDPSMMETDEAWKIDARENMSQLGQRVLMFLQLLVQRTEDNIVVVSHGVFIEACLQQHAPQALDYGKQRVYNCDMFAMDCVSRDGKFVRIDNTHKI
jgi:broad specificity phosphatase PhoE